MRTLRQLLLGSTLLAALFASATAGAASSAETWLNHYYQNPNPDGLKSAVFQLSRDGFLDDDANVPLTIGFLSSVFAQNPARVDEWLAFGRDLPAAHQRIVIAAAWASGNPSGVAEFRRIAARSAADRDNLNALLAATPDLATAPVLSPSSLNAKWGSFLATGDRAPVQAILAALGNDDRSQFGQDVRWSLARNAAAHDRVLAICKDELVRQPNELRESLKAVIHQVENRTPSS
ncbi:MAG TPA: hypothetical protein VK477_13745 [Acidobacteriota bacterium]|nr:hypothetical protein [Acidobacteriota bacterium]